MPEDKERSVRMPEDLWSRLQAEARKENRTTTGQLRQILAERYAEDEANA